MVGFFTLTLSVVAGVSLCAGFYQLMVARRRYATHGLTVNAWFGVLAILVGSYALGAVFAYQAQSLSGEISASRFQMAMACLALPALLHFLGLYTGCLPSRAWRWAGGLVFGGLFIVNAVAPFGLLYDAATGLQFVELPWGERLTYMQATSGVWSYVFFATIGAVFCYGFYTCGVMAWRGQRVEAWVLGIALGVFALTVAADIVTSLRIWRGVYFAEFGFLALVIIMGLRLVDEMQSTEGRLNQILAATHEGVWTIDVRQQTDYVNDRMAAMLGYTPQEMVGRSLFDFMDDQARVECERNLARRKSGIEERHDFRLSRKDGSDLWVSMWTAPIRDHSGRYCGAIAMVSDLSERRAIRRELEHREIELRRAQRVARIGSWSWDTQTGEIVLSDELMRLYGIPSGAFDGTFDYLFERVIHPEDVHLVRASSERNLATGISEPLVFRVVHPNGQVRYILGEGEVVTDQGRVVSLFGTAQDITEQRLAENQLRESRQRFRTLAEASPSLVFQTDARGHAIYANDVRWVQITGRAAGQWAGEGWLEAIHPDDREVVVASWRHAVAHRQPWRHEFRFQHTDGQDFWEYAQAKPIYGEDEAFEGFVGICTDITAQKYDQWALEESRKFVERIAEASPFGLYVFDLKEQKNVYVNRHIARDLAYGEEQIRAMGHRFMDELLHPDDRDRRPGGQEHWQGVADGQVVESEYRLRHADGTWRWFAGRDIVFTRDGEGAVRQIIGSAEDITDRKRFETQLRESEVQLRALIERVPGITYTATASLPITMMYVSPQCELVLGYSAYEIITEASAYFDQVVHGDDLGRVRAAFDRCVTQGQPVDMEYRVIAKDEQEKWVRDRAVLVRNDEGEPLFVQGIVSDVTERRRQEQERYDRLTRAWRLQSTILELATSPAVLQGDWSPSLRQVGKSAAEAIGVDRVGVWMLRDGGQSLYCESLYLADQDRCESGHAVQADAYPAYFQSLLEGLAVDAHDAQTDPRTCEFAESYLKPLGITSMIDAPIRVAGRVVGVLCVEHVGAPRRWSADETSFAIAIADQVTHLIERRDRLVTEKALTDVERRLRAVISNSPIVLFAMNRDGVFTLTEGRGLKQLRLMPSDLIGQSVFVVYADYPKVLADVRRALEGNAFIAEADLDDFVYEVQYEPVWDGDQVTSVIGVATDITQRRFAERETERQREEFQAVLDSMPVKVIFKDTQNNILRVNRAVSTPLGVTPDEMADTPSSQWYPAEADRYAAEDRRVIETGEPILGLVEPVRSGLEEGRWLHVDKYPLRDEVGEIIGVIFLAIDITDRINAESALRESEERYDLVLKGISEGLWDWKIATDEVFISDRLRSLLGYGTISEFPNEIASFNTHLHPDDGAPTWAAVDRHLKDRVPYDVEFRVRTKSGAYRWFRGRGQAIWDAQGKPVRMAGSIQDIHDRKQAELELFESRQLLEGVLNTIPVRIFWKDRDSNYLGCNVEFAQDGGLKSPEQVVGLTDYDMFTEENADAFRTDDHHVITTGISKLGYEEPQVQPDGLEHWLRTSKVPLKNPEGEIIGVLGTYEDVTNRKRADEALRRVAEGLSTSTGEAFYRSLVQSLGEALGVRYAFIGSLSSQEPKTVETMAVYANGQIVDNMLYALDGTPGENVLIRDRDTCIYADQVTAQFPNDTMLIDMGVESYAGTPLIDSAGQLHGLLAVLDDKPFADSLMVESLLKVFGVRGASEMERQASLDLLRQTELRFRTVFDQSPNGIVVLDVDAGKFIMANANASRIYGLSRQELMHVGPLELSPPTQPDGRSSSASAAQYIQAAIKGTPQTFEWWHVNADGQQVPCEISLVQLPARDRRLVLATVMDISERIDADHRQRQQQAELARVGRVIMAGELASGLAHELNQPLGAIANYSAACQHLIKDATAVPAKVLEMIRTMGLEAERAGQIIRHLRRLVERREVQQQAVDLNALIVRTVDLVRPELRKHNVAVRLYLGQNLPSVAADPVQVEQIVLNLLLNAMEAIEGSHGEDRRIAIRCKRLDDREVEVLVRDTGPGVSGENPDRVFDPFYTTKATGLGMGLHICRSIIESHNGRMWVCNHARGGAEFGFALRLFEPEPSE